MTGAARGRNEALFREVNERIEAVSKDVPPEEELMGFLCECDNTACTEKVNATRAEYEAVRAVATHFIVLAATRIRRSSTSFSGTNTSWSSRKRAGRRKRPRRAIRETGRKPASVQGTERRRSRTDRAVGCTTALVLKTSWATGPMPLRLRA